MCLAHPEFSKLMRSTDFTKNIALLAVDEVHCVSQWRDNFRKCYVDLGRFRSYISNSVPILAASATLPPSILKQVQACLLISKNDSFLVNLGNDRLNIMSILCHMCGAASDLAALDFTLDEGLSGNALKRTIIFFNTRELTQLGYRHLKRQLPQNMHDQIGFLHACRTTDAKNETMESFQEGKIKILCATEAAGMVRRILSFINVLYSNNLSTRDWIYLISNGSSNIWYPHPSQSVFSASDVLDEMASQPLRFSSLNRLPFR